jgi:hypothetical protein
MAGLVRLNVPTGADMRLLTVRGRSTGRERTTPAAVFEDRGEKYLLGTFGDTQWVRNCVSLATPFSRAVGVVLGS